MPYIHPGFGHVTELDAPDKSAVFLTIGTCSNIDEEILVRYLLEAPPGYPMREAFENGEISIEDFADHRGWLIRLQKKILSPEDFVATYIHPTQIDPRVRRFYRRFESVGPYQKLVDGLKTIRDIQKKCGLEYNLYDVELEHIYKNYSSKVAA